MGSVGRSVGRWHTHPGEGTRLGDERGLAVVLLDEPGQAQVLDVVHLFFLLDVIDVVLLVHVMLFVCA